MSSRRAADMVHEESMIRLTRLNRAPMVLNADLIEHIDVTPDTVITLTTGQILRVRETAEEVVRRIVEFRRRIYSPAGDPSGLRDPADPAGSLEQAAAPEEAEDTN
jgi:flagellar protein FlbD